MRRAATAHRYRAFGLDIGSEVELPQLPRAVGASAPDVEIEFGEVEPGLHSEPGYRRGKIYDQFRYEVTGGRDIVVEPLPGSAASNIADGIMSRVLTILFYQRGLLPLHAAAIACRGAAIAICGPSGAGKSTLAATIAARGGEVIADDMLVLAPEGVQAWPGAGGLKLAPASLVKIGRSTAGLALANQAEGKYFLPLPPASAAQVSVATLVRLGEGPPGVRSLARAEAVAQWRHCVRQPELVEVAPDAGALWRRWLDLVASIKVLAVSHGREMDALDGIADRLLSGAD